MTPADELRAAAARLRALAEAASTDRYGRDTSTWISEQRSPTDARLLTPDRTPILHGGSSGPNGRGTRPHLHPQHAAYIAAMHPGVGTALADMLTQWAHAADLDPDLLNRIGGPETLAIARLINQEQS